MTLSRFLSIASVLALVFGIAFVLAPIELLAQYGVAADAGTAFLGRLYGSALIELGLLVWLAREIADPVGRHAVVLAGFVASALALAIALYGQLTGVTNALGWSTVVIFVFLAAGYGYFQFGAKA